MYIKSMVIDGFKTYGRRTEINGFDREFNAITGLNGSGKSNILDAICFVLGLQNLGQVRAALLQDLVYKLGQTGVTKASVTITFDNSDKQQSPVGYESYSEIMVTRQVVMGGKNKYLINGVNAQNNRVKDLFCSVQLNVNNPHFLVMQGRITKVLNMKPLEILSMIEEAAGTRMFESKKQQAEKTLLKKDQKLEEIDKIVDEEINPKLTKLKEERGQYLEFKKVEREVEHSQKIFIAWKYKSTKEAGSKAIENCTKLREAIQDKRKYIEDGQKSLKDIEKNISELKNLKNAEYSGKLQTLESDLREKEKNLTKFTGKHNQNVDSIQGQVKIIKELQNNIKDDESILKTKSNSLSKIDDVFNKLTENRDQDRINLEKAQNKLQAVSSGLVGDNESGEATLEDLLMKSSAAIKHASAETKRCQHMKSEHEVNLKKKMTEMKSTEGEYKDMSKNLNNLEREVSKLEQQLNANNYDEERYVSLQTEHRQILQSRRSLKDQADRLESGDPRLVFRYQDPEPNFNRKSVHGLVCRLFQVPDPAFAIAIEKTGGGRLFNVVVDNEAVGSKLLKNGKLESRRTLIPLNKISGYKLDERIISTAERLVGKGNVWSAISLVQYDPVYESAMQFIFGSTLICRDLNSAQKVCFHPEIMKKCVTLDGDVYDPSGVTSGGAKQKTQPILTKLLEVKAIMKDLEAKNKKFANIERELADLKSKEEAYMVLKQKYDVQSKELNELKQKLSRTTHFNYQEEVNQLKQKIQELVEKQNELKEVITIETNREKEIKDKIKNAKVYKEKQLALAHEDVKKCKDKLQKSEKEIEKREEEYNSLKFGLEELKKSVENNKVQIEKHEKLMEELKTQGEVIENEVAEAKQVVKSLEVQVKKLKEAMGKVDKDIAEAEAKHEKIMDDSREFGLQIKQLEQNEDKAQHLVKASKAALGDMLRSHEWIQQDEQDFGRPNGIYDFREYSPEEAGKRIDMLQELKEKLSRNINTKAMNLLTKTEELYNDLMKKRKQVQDDKKTIIAVIQDLDEKKKDALKQAWLRVNKDFGSIFSSLLPGAVAKLEPPPNKTVLDGLEFRVGFGGKFKESLGELSGGQRSLVALSLILSMLLFKPAPIYILDEVDAALDLSHTQNIGNMLKKHFKNSQFIVVSLKDGMFSNANVLFRTKFVDGMSTVTRFVQQQK